MNARAAFQIVAFSSYYESRVQCHEGSAESISAIGLQPRNDRLATARPVYHWRWRIRRVYRLIQLLAATRARQRR